MSAYRYNIVLSSEGDSTVVITDADLNTRVIDESHPNFVRIVDGLRQGEDITEWLDGNPVEAFARLSDQVAIIDGVLHFDGDATHNGLANTIMRYRREGREFYNLVRFMERLSATPSYRSREQLFTWAQAKDLTIDADGYIIGFKGVSEDMLSLNAGKAKVDGVDHNGRIPNFEGAVISMPRSEVNDDPTKGCSAGLHVGTWSYASSWGPVLLEVRIDPADVVSVPADCGFAKLRCCRYEVLAVHETEDDDLSDYEPYATFDEDEAMDAFMEYVPPSFMQRLRDKLRRRGGDER